ncbi:MAG: tRNA (N(6)-L-threonylcarbamoyladenosine(37)-C(2))-methylthiotransferase [Candidatus Bathyarchaeia archaeon]
MTRPPTIYLENYGCTSNLFDYEVIRGILRNIGYVLTENEQNADAVIINSCGVKKQTEDKILHRLKQVNSLGKPVIVTGCLPKINLNAIFKAVPEAWTLDPASLYKLPEVLQKAVKANPTTLKLTEYTVKLLMPKFRCNRLREIVLISEGCLGECTYCCARNARGRLASYPPEMIISTVKKAVGEGVKEICLTAQDTGSYGLDIGTTLPSLLQRIIDIPGDFKVRLGMMNPDRAFRLRPSLIPLLKHEKMYRFLHIPVQSGSDKALTHMKRRYTRSEFIELVKAVRESVEDVTIATDVIVGYPTESEDDFQETITLLEETKPQVVNVSRYTPRPQTPAAKLPPLPKTTVTNRLKHISNICRRIALRWNSLTLHKKYQVRILEKSSRGNYVGRTHNYRRVIITYSPRNLLGETALVRIEGFTERYLLGSIVEDPHD